MSTPEKKIKDIWLTVGNIENIVIIIKDNCNDDNIDEKKKWNDDDSDAKRPKEETAVTVVSKWSPQMSPNT